MKRDDSLDAVECGFAKIGLERAQRHLLLCIGPDCCASEQGAAVWEYLKQALKTHGLPVLRTKAACLRICHGGPWLVVYPEGVWYGGVTVERCEQIIAEHLLGGRIIKEWASKMHPLPTPTDSLR